MNHAKNIAKLLKGGIDKVSVKKIAYDSGFWKIRATHYDELEWVNDRSYLSAFTKAGKFRKTDTVLDIGTGTGIVAHAIAPFVKKVIALDKSPKMLKQGNWDGHMYFVKWNILNPLFANEVFDRVTMRHVLHHILRGTQKTINECYRVLKKGGLLVLSEGIPPSPEVKEDYIEIFKLKEKRLTFMEEDLVALMKEAGFQNIQTETFWLRQMSIRNWLSNSGLPRSIQDKIFGLHANAADYFKRAYNMVEVEGDCLIDMKMLILTGVK